jgi:hypothetical protein
MTALNDDETLKRLVVSAHAQIDWSSDDGLEGRIAAHIAAQRAADTAAESVPATAPIDTWAQQHALSDPIAAIKARNDPMKAAIVHALRNTQ